jgi:drug/metabolite transporter (DMT)-like permease
VSWLAISLLCGFFLATADALSKRFLGDYTATELTLARLVWTGALLAPLLLVTADGLPSLSFWAYMAVLTPLEILGLACYMAAIQGSALAESLPYLAFTPVFTLVTGYVFLGEQASVHGGLGVLVVVLGAYVLNIEHLFGGGAGAWFAPLRAIGRARGPRLMLSAAAIYSLTSVLGKAAMQHVSPGFFGPLYYVILGSAAALYGLIKPKVLGRSLCRRPGWSLLIAVAMAGMVLTHFLAIKIAPSVAYVLAVKRCSILFGIAYGAWWFHERDTLRSVLAGVLVVSGVVLIQWQ